MTLNKTLNRLVFVGLTLLPSLGLAGTSRTYDCALEPDQEIRFDVSRFALALEGDRARVYETEWDGRTSQYDATLAGDGRYYGFAYYDTEWATWMQLDSALSAGKKQGSLVIRADNQDATQSYSCKAR
jgi:hypothetical protein